MIKVFLAIIFLVCSLSGIDKLYFLPKDKDIVKDEIVNQLKNAKKSIIIAMYNFKYVKFANALALAAQNGVDVKVYYYKKRINFSKNIKALKVRNKLHTKVALIDDKTVIFGSANWTKESFKKNYEVIYITDRDELVKEFINFFSTIKR